MNLKLRLVATNERLQGIAGLAAAYMVRLPTWSVFDALLGELARRAQRRPVGDAVTAIDRQELARMARDSAAGLSIVAAQVLPSVSPRDLIRRADQPNLTHAAARLIALHDDWRNRSAALYDAAISPAEMGPHRLSSAFLAIAQTAETLQSNHARGILRQALILAAQPVNPYEPPGLHALARYAAAAIVAEHSELDSYVQELLIRSPSRTVVEVVASGLHIRRKAQQTAVAEALESWRPDRQRAEAFVKIVDAKFEAAAVRQAPRGNPWWWSLLVSLSGTAVALAIPPIGSVLGAVYLANVIEVAPPVQLSLMAALAVLGVLYAIDVYTTEQSALRLPGVLARYASRAKPLTAAYSSAVTLTSAVVFARIATQFATEAKWSATISAGCFVAASALLLRGVVARLDPANAA